MSGSAVGKTDKSQSGWTSQGRNSRQCSDEDNEGLSLTQAQVLREQTRKRKLREGQKLLKVIQQVLGFCKQLLSTLLSPCPTDLDKRKPTGALLMWLSRRWPLMLSKLGPHKEEGQLVLR